MPAPKILVVYYSWWGTTRKIAKALAETLSCDLEEIVEPRKRAWFLGYARSVIEARQKRPSVIMPAHGDVSSYDLVVVGTPVWAWSVSSPVRAYLMANKDRLPAVAFFCTLGARGSENAFAQMQSVTGKAPRAVLAVTTRAVASGSYREPLMSFVKAIASS
jgi:menaquinone-dependent protoporphyrinogen IX oxidase